MYITYKGWIKYCNNKTSFMKVCRTRLCFGLVEFLIEGRSAFDPEHCYSVFCITCKTTEINEFFKFDKIHPPLHHKRSFRHPH